MTRDVMDCLLSVLGFVLRSPICSLSLLSSVCSWSLAVVFPEVGFPGTLIAHLEMIIAPVAHCPLFAVTS